MISNNEPSVIVNSNFNYNNIGISSLSIGLVLNESKEISLTKAILITPLVTHADLLKLLCRKNNLSKGSASLISSNPTIFSNFNERFQEQLPLSLNSIQFLAELNYATVSGKMIFNKEMGIDKSYGKRAVTIYKAAKKISNLLQESEEELYTNLSVGSRVIDYPPVKQLGPPFLPIFHGRYRCLMM